MNILLSIVLAPFALIVGMLLGLARTWPLWMFFAIGYFLLPKLFG